VLLDGTSQEYGAGGTRFHWNTAGACGCRGKRPHLQRLWGDEGGQLGAEPGAQGAVMVRSGQHV
jgi:hypothetical protein